MFKQTTFALLTIVLVVGCAKEKSYDKVYKEVEQLKKSDIKITKVYVCTNDDGDAKRSCRSKTILSRG